MTKLQTYAEATQNEYNVYDSDEECEYCEHKYGDHLVAPIRDQSNLYGWSLLDASNLEAQSNALDDRAGLCDHIEGFTMLVPGSEAAAEAEEIEEALENYPLLDEEDFYEREHESALESWESWQQEDFLKSFHAYLVNAIEHHPDFDLEEDIPLYLEDLLEFHGLKESDIVSKFWEYSGCYVEEETFTWYEDTTNERILEDFELLSVPPSKFQEIKDYRTNLAATSPLPYE
jgi:hypothetical protein